MITKDNLLEMLERSLKNEDEFITNYGKDFLDKVGKVSVLNEEEKVEIKDLLTSMLEDTQRHSGTINALIDKIKGMAKNEF